MRPVLRATSAARDRYDCASGRSGPRGLVVVVGVAGPVAARALGPAIDATAAAATAPSTSARRRDRATGLPGMRGTSAHDRPALRGAATSSGNPRENVPRRVGVEKAALAAPQR